MIWMQSLTGIVQRSLANQSQTGALPRAGLCLTALPKNIRRFNIHIEGLHSLSPSLTHSHSPHYSNNHDKRAPFFSTQSVSHRSAVVNGESELIETAGFLVLQSCNAKVEAIVLTIIKI